MQMIKVSPDDVLKGAGGYREKMTVDCPACGESTEVKTDSSGFECSGCGTEFGLDKPFS